MIRALFVVATALLAVACAPTKPIVDASTMPDQTAYQRDLYECTLQARLGFDAGIVARDEAVQRTITSAATQGALQGLAAAPFGAAGGLIAGGFTGPEKAARQEQRAVGRCLENRGYRIANAEDLWLTPVLWCLDIGLTNWVSTTEEQHQACIKAEEKRRAELDRKLMESRSSASQQAQ